MSNPMPYRVVLKNITHRKMEQAAIIFNYDTRLKAIVCAFKGVTWSRTHGCFYIPNTRDLCNKLYAHLRAHEVFVDYSTFKVLKNEQAKPAPDLPSPYELQLFNDFRAFLEGKRYSQSTVQTYMQLAAPFIQFMQGSAITTATPDQVRLYIEQLVARKNYSISTHRQLVSALKLLLELHKNPMPLAHLERPKKSRYKPVVLNNNEVIRLLQCTVNLKHRCILAIIYCGGLRVSEALALKPHDIDVERMQLHVRNSKGRKDRYVGIASSFVPLLLNYLNSYKPRDYLFEGAIKGEMYSANSVRAFLKQNCKAANITKPVTPHTLRHSYATHLVENGTGIAHIQRLLGHAKPETTMLYTHIANTDLVKIENPLDLAVSKSKAAINTTKNFHISRKNNL